MGWSRMMLSKEFLFNGKHKLEGTKGEPLHEHRYKLRITVKGKLNDLGMVYDSRTLIELIKEKVIHELHNSFLNDILPQPTTENLAKWVWKEIEPEIKGLHTVQLWENPTQFVTYDGGG